MSFDDTFRLSSHAVITDSQQRVLLLKSTYGEKSWGLPGGALDKGETIHQALHRECLEELGCMVDIEYLSGVYYHQAYNSQVFIFKCLFASLPAEIKISSEHSEFKYLEMSTLSTVQRRRVSDCLNFSGKVVSAKF